MISDRIENLEKYSPVSASISELSGMLSYREEGNDTAFRVNRKKAELYIVKKGEARFCTTWRENAASDDVTAVIKAGEGYFVLYLPGEPVLVKADENSLITKYNLE
jgi:hypothetical protein